MRVRRWSTPSQWSAGASGSPQRCLEAERLAAERRRHPLARSVAAWRFVVPLLAASRRAGAAAAIIAASALVAGAPAALAGDEAHHPPPTLGGPPPAPHVDRPPAALEGLPAQQTPTPEDDIPDVALTLGGASHTVDVAGYFTDSVNGYDVSASPRNIVRTSRSGTEITIEPVAAGSAIVTVSGRKPSGRERKRFTVTVSAMVSAPTATGAIAAATITEGATHAVTASDYLSGDGVTYAAASSDSEVATVAVSGVTITVTAVAAGEATVTVTATNAGGSAEQEFAVTVVPPGPAAVGAIAALTLTESSTRMVTASDYFSGDGVTYAAASSDSEVATVAVSGVTVTVTAVAAGEATVTVKATNAGGSAEQSFAVTVQLPAVTLTVDGAARVIELSDHFGSDVTGYDVLVSVPGVVGASLSGSQLTLTPLGVGTVTVTVEVIAGETSALHQFAVTVAPAAPAAVGSVPALTLAEHEAGTVTASDYFAGERVTYDAESSDTEVATVAVDGAVVTVTAVAAGSATITVRATNEGGKAEQSFVVTIQLPAVALTLGGAAREIELVDYFGDEVTGYEVTVSPSGIVHVSRSGSQLTLTAVAAGEATVTVTATNAGGSAEQSFAVTVVPPAPEAVESIAPATVTEGAIHTVTASDYFEGEGATYTAESSDALVVTVAVDGAAVTVTAVATGSATVTVTATNSGGSAEQSFAVTVVPPAPEAVGSIAPATVTEGAIHTVTASDYFEGEGATHTAESSDALVVTVEVEGAAVTVTAVAAGEATVTVTATNAGGSAEQSFAVTVVPSAPEAVGSIAPATLAEGATHMVTASDYFEGEGATYTAESSDPGVATVEVEGAAVAVTGVATGSATVMVTATNAGGSAEQSFAVTVAPSAPTAGGSIAPATLAEGATHMVTASDYFEGEGATYTAESSDPGVATVEVEGAAVAVTAVAVGEATVTVTATNSGGSAEQSFEVTVVPPAPEAVGSIAPATVTEGAIHTVTASDYFEGEGATYTAESSDAQVVTVEVEGAAVTLTAVAVGEATVTVTATNAGGSAEQSFAVTVVPPAPTAVGSIGPATLAEGATHTVTASDYFEGEGATYTAESSDALVVTVAVDGAAVTATNSGGSAEQSFAVTVVPSAPMAVGSIEAATITEGATHTVTASDYFSGEGLTYTAESSDPGVATVEVEGAAVTVTAVATGSATVTVTATNSGGSADQSFAVTVVPPAPEAVGSIAPATLAEGATHMVTASDYFEGEGATYTAESSDAQVVTVAVSGVTVTVTGVTTGSATVTVTATNAGGSAEQSFAVTVVPPAPEAVGSIEAMTLAEGGGAQAVDLTDHFSGVVLQYGARAVPGGVVHLWMSGSRLTLTPLATGVATVTVTALSAGGSAGQTFAVTVQARVPRALGAVPLTRLTEGEVLPLDAAAYFEGTGVTYTARSSDAGVAEVEMYGAAALIKGAAAGVATVTVTAANGSGSADQDFVVVVAPRVPRAAGSMADQTLIAGGAALETDLPGYFSGAFTRYGAAATPGGVVHLWESGGRLTLTPLAAGAATVTVWAANSSGSATQTFEVLVKQSAPKALAGSMPVRLTEGGAPHELDLADYFGGAVARYDVTTVPGGVVHLWQSGGRLTVTPLSTGIATVTVTATNDSGSSVQRFDLAVAPAAPRALGGIDGVALSGGGAARAIELLDYFEGAIVSYEVSAVPDGVLHLWESGGRLTLTPLAAGVATVTVTAANASGSAGQVFAVAVEPDAPAALGRIEGVTLTVGGDAGEVVLADHFAGRVERYGAAADPAGVVHLWQSQGRLWLTPLSAGAAMVTVTATNTAGSAEQAFAVAVAPAVPRALGGMADVALAAGGEAQSVELADFFSGVVVRYVVTADAVGVVHLWESGGRLRLTPLAAGVATVTVTALNGSGSAEQQFAVTVEPPVAAGP